VADVRDGEAPTALLLTFNVFMLLMAYYLLKVAREPLILLGGGAEVKQFAAAGQSVLLIFVNLVYGALASRVGRMKLIAYMSFFFISNLAVFAVLARFKVPIGVPFFLWVGIFNRMVIAQFWAFGADIYAGERGKRLFPVLGVGSSAGAVAGATIADRVLFLGPDGLMWVAAAVLAACVGVSWMVDRRESHRVAQVPGTKPEEVFGHENAFSMMLKDRYLVYVGLLLLVLNLVNSMGEFILDRTMLAGADASAALEGISDTEFIGHFKARYFEWINILGMGLQLFFVSRIIKYVGVRKALFVMPLAALGGYGSLLIVPTLSVVFYQKVIENSLDYSLANTTQQSLWLVTSREAKYKVKQLADTFIVRAGDAITAVLVMKRWGFSTTFLVMVNLVGVAVWLLILGLVVKEHKRREDAAAESAQAALPVEAAT
jgi:AAA family ATP:ADP antiporter